MARQAISAFSGAALAKGTSRLFRSRLALTTILAVAPFMGYGRQAFANCDPTGPSTYSCSGASGAQTITANNANVSTVAGFSVNTATDNGITITGDGHLQYIDPNASPITSTNDDGLYVRSTGDDGATDGAVTINTNGNITGGFRGIYARNDGSGNIAITSNGEVEGQGAVHGDGIYALNYGNNLTITTGVGSSTTGADEGIDAVNQGSGNLVINANGDVDGANDGIAAYNSPDGGALTVNVGAQSGVTAGHDGIYALNYGSGLTITAAAGSDISGGDEGIDVVNKGSGDLKITANGDVDGANDGILAYNSSSGGDLTVITGAQSFVTAGNNGIDARNFGFGDLNVTTNGYASGGNDGIYAYNSSNGADLTVITGAASVIKGENNYGIQAVNFGNGDLAVTANGSVYGYGADGIFANNDSNGGAITVATGAGSYVYGYQNGIRAVNQGSGDVEVIANGDVTGYSENGIDVYNSANGANLKVTTGPGSYVYGYENGIGVTNLGSGTVEITANGDITGHNGNGIDAYNSADGTNLKVTTGAGTYVYGLVNGINITNLGSGAVEITTNGDVTGQNRNGIDTYNSVNGTDLKITTGPGTYVYGNERGINATNLGSGNVDITANGAVTGQNEDGISAYNSANGANLKITTGAGSYIYGNQNGVTVTNLGSGDVDITANGAVTGDNEDGIRAYNSANGVDLKIATGAGAYVYGYENGISAMNLGAGDLKITANGIVTGYNESGIVARNIGDGNTFITVGPGGLAQGSYAGILAESDHGQNIKITNDGVVRNYSGETFDLAIVTRTGATTVNNNNLLVGTVDLSEFDDTLNNTGLWNPTNGISDFGAGAFDAVNNSGRVQAANDPLTNENTAFVNLEFFNNSGLISLVDGEVGDVLQMGVATEFVGQGGKLAVDAFLDPAGAADQLLINGNSSGTTNLVVNLTNPIGSSPNFDGIAVISVSGTTAEEDFNIEGGVLNAGFFAWDLRLDGATHELYTTGLGAGSFEFAAGITGAQDIWYQTTGTLLQRQADLRALLKGTQVTPVADFAEPVEPTPAGHVTPGFWLKGVGAYLERDQDEANNVETDRKQTTWGFLGGFDFGTENLRDQGDALMFGLLGGYITSDLDFDQTNTEWQYEGPTVGAYATYLDDAFYADVTVKADFLDVDIDASDIAPGDGKADTDVLNIGGLVDTGYKIPLDHGLFVEPQASLAVVHTEIDDIDDIFGGAVEFDDETSVRGRLGLRLGHELTASNQIIYSSDVTASVWEEFNGDNNATIVAPLFPTTGVADDPGETFGDVSIGFSAQSPEGWSSFLRANYTFASDYDAFTGNAGVRYAW